MLSFKHQLPILALIPLTFGSILGADGNPNFVSPYSGNYLLAQREMSLDDRYPEKSVNEVFKSNILLNMAYLSGKVHSQKDIKWDEVLKPFEYEFKLEPSKTFAFHSDVEDKYQDSLVKTTSAHFNASEGFKTDGYLFGDGVCHLASLIYWVARDAGLSTEAPTNHNFATIPDIPREFGVGIYNNPGAKTSNALQNLYITNNLSKPITFKFEYTNDTLKVSAVQLN